jgi:hypothetical protein
VLAELVAAGGFEGKQGQATRPVRVLGASAAHVALAGVGKREKAAAVAEWGQSPYQALGASIASLCKANKLKTAALAWLAAPPAPAAAAQRVVTGALLGGYESTRWVSLGGLGGRGRPVPRAGPCKAAVCLALYLSCSAPQYQRPTRRPLAHPPHRACPPPAAPCSFKSKAPKGGRLEALTLLGLAGTPDLDTALETGAAVAKGALLTRCARGPWAGGAGA